MLRILRALVCVPVLVFPAALIAADQNNTNTPSLTFSVKIDGVAIGGVHTIEGMESETEVVEYRSGSDTDLVRKLPGHLRYGNVRITREVSSDTSFATWRKLVEDGQFPQAKKGVAIAVVDRSNHEIARWSLIKAWPSKLSIDRDKDTGNPVEVIVLVVDAITRP